MSEKGYTSEEGHPELRQLDDGTKIRYKYQKGDLAGTVIDAEIQEGHIIYEGASYSPTGAARAALRDLRGEDYELNGWEWWEYQDDEGNWKILKSIRD
jgi:hypothetical protein